MCSLHTLHIFSVPFFQGVSIPMLGTFTFTQKKLDIGKNKFIMMQRPIFMLSEKFAQTHGLQSVKYHVPGQSLFLTCYCAIIQIQGSNEQLILERFVGMTMYFRGWHNVMNVYYDLLEVLAYGYTYMYERYIPVPTESMKIESQ